MARGRGAELALLLIARTVACSNDVGEADQAVCDLSGEFADAIAADVGGEEWREAAAAILDQVGDVRNGEVRTAASGSAGCRAPARRVSCPACSPPTGPFGRHATTSPPEKSA